MRRSVIVGLLALSLLFAALPFAGAAMFQKDDTADGASSVRVPVLADGDESRDNASTKVMPDGSGCPFAQDQQSTQF